MRIWQLHFELDKYDNLMPVTPLPVEELQSFDGRSHAKVWCPLQVERITLPGRQSLPYQASRPSGI